MKNSITIDDAIAVLTKLKEQHGGKVKLVMPTGQTEDDWDRYTVFSFVSEMVYSEPVGFGCHSNNPHVQLRAGDDAFKH